jgi:transposase
LVWCVTKTSERLFAPLTARFADVVAVVIPSTASRKIPLPFDTDTDRQRNVIERMFRRLKDFRHIATRYDKLARNFLSAIAPVAAMLWRID